MYIIQWKADLSYLQENMSKISWPTKIQSATAFSSEEEAFDAIKHKYNKYAWAKNPQTYIEILYVHPLNIMKE